MAEQATSLEELRRLLQRPQQIIDAHIEAVRNSGGQPIQMPQVVHKPSVAPTAQQVAPVQPVQSQGQTITSPKTVPPKKGGCGCWGQK